MSKFNWRNGFAVGLTLGVFGTILFALGLATYPGESAHPSTSYKETDNIGPQDNRWWLVGRVVYMDDTAAQWLMAFFTFSAVVLIFLTLKDTRQMLTETREIGQAQVRAHLHLEIVDVNIDAIEVNGVEHLRAKFECKVHNSGNSPANRLSVLYDICQSIVGEVVSVNTDGSELSGAMKSISTIPSKGEVFVELKRTFPADITALRGGRSHVGLSYVIKMRRYIRD